MLPDNLSFLTSLDFIFYLIFGLAVLSGLIRGFKKTVFAFVTNLIFYAVFFLTIDQVVGFLWTFDMPWLGSVMSNIDPALANFTNFSDSLPTILGVFLGDTFDLTTASAHVMELAVGLGMFALKLVYTLLYFTVILLVWKLICWILQAILIHSQEGESKNRGMGAIFGTLNGALSVFVSLIMLGGFLSVVESMTTFLDATQTPTTQLAYVDRHELYEADYQIIPLATTEMPDITSELQMLHDMIDSYHANIFVQIADSITVTKEGTTEEIPLHLSLFDSVLSFDIDTTQVSIRYELAVYSQAMTVLIQSDFYANPELSSITGAEIHQIFAILANSDLITALAPIAIEVGSDIYEQDLGIPIEDLYAIDYQAEFETLGAVAETLFDILSNSGAFSGGGVEVNVTGDDVRTLFGDMSDSSLVVLLASALIIPMLENGDSTISAIVTVPDGLDWSAELVAVGNVLGAIVDSGVTISDLEGGDPAVFLNAVSSVDLTMLMSSELITNALINILSGDAGIEGLDFLTIPDDIVWRDTYDGSGNLIQAGELRNILVALNAITGVLTNFDFNNLDMSFVSELSDDVIDDIFESRVLVATISTMLLSQDLGDLPLVIPNDVFDGDGYLLKGELKALAKSIALVVSGVDQGFDVQIILNLTETDIQTLLSSRIVAATVGKMVYDMGSDILTIPATVVESVAVDASTVDVVDATELQAILMSLKVLDLTNFDNLAFDASILSSLELIPDVGDPTELDDAKIDTLLSSEIIHATVSQMIIDLGSGASTLLTIPEEDVDGNAIVETVSGTDYVAKAELHALLQALYAIGIGDFATMSFEDTSLILTHKDLLLESAMIHATISSMILDLASGAITIPQTDVLGNPILVAYSDVTYISRTELSAFLDALQLLGIGDPTAFTNSLDLSVLSTGENQDIYLSSAIMHATTSQTLIDLGAGVLLIPLLEEDGVTPVQAQVGPVGDQTTYIVKDEIKAMIDAFLIMGFGDLSSFGGSISSTLIFDHIDTVLLSSSLQATISDQLLNVTSGSLIIPDEDELGNPIRIVQSDVTYVAQTEILAIVDALDMLGLTDLSTFDMTPAVLFTVDFNDLLASATMHATVSDYVLQAAVDETAAPGSAALVIPSDLRENFDLAGVVDDGERVQKAELILLLTSLQTLGITDFSASMDASVISGLESAELDTVLASDSMQMTIDNMLQGNTNINTSIPDLAKEDVHNTTGVVTKTEIRDFILASDKLATGDFTNASFSYAAIAAMPESDRDIVLNSMIVRNILTDQLEAFLPLDDILPPPGDLYWPANDKYMNNDPNTFLTEAGINEVFAHYGWI